MVNSKLEWGYLMNLGACRTYQLSVDRSLIFLARREALRCYG